MAILEQRACSLIVPHKTISSEQPWETRPSFLLSVECLIDIAIIVSSRPIRSGFYLELPSRMFCLYVNISYYYVVSILNHRSSVLPFFHFSSSFA